MKEWCTIVLRGAKASGKIGCIVTCCVYRVERLPAIKEGSQSSPGPYLGLSIASLLHKKEHGAYRRIGTYCTSVTDICTET